MKLSHFDRTMIHGLELMSRSPMIPDPDNHRMLLRILETAASRASASEQLRPLIREVRRVSENLGPHRAIEHHIRRAMDDFDRMCMAVHWDAAKGGS